MPKKTSITIVTLLLFSCAITSINATEVTKLTPKNWDDFVPAGKEVDAIYGDYAIRNDVLTAIIAQPKQSRNANLTVRNVYGGVLDLTRNDDNNDQLSCFYPTNQRFTFTDEDTVKIQHNNDGSATLSFTSLKRADSVQAVLTYSLANGDSGLTISTSYHNHSEADRTISLQDGIRADSPFTSGVQDGMYWTNDNWFRQAYGIMSNGYSITRTGGGGRILKYEKDKSSDLIVAANVTFQLSRTLIPSGSLLGIQAEFAQRTKNKTSNVSLTCKDKAGPIHNANIRLSRDGAFYGDIRTNGQGTVKFGLAHGKYTAVCSAQGRPDQTFELTCESAIEKTITFDRCGYVAARITNQHDLPIGCKITFYGTGETKDPDFGPKQAAVRAMNLFYALRGTFRQELTPGTYELIFSHGPEHDIVIKTVNIQAGQTTSLEIQLDHVVDTSGWISTDYHTHSSPSGDNTSVQIGRVISLICEQIDYAPCTEHQRISSYTPLLKELGVEHLMGTSTGMELTGRELPVNHQNAFPLKHVPRTQDGGGPTIEDDPVRQIAKLAGWNDNAYKLVQEDHPTLMQIYQDRDRDDKPDSGFRDMFQYMDVMEVHPLQSIFDVPESPKPTSNRSPVMFHWMQLLNLGYRIPGVVNSDSHYNEHSVGYIRNYVKSATDNPGRIRTKDIVKASKAGNVVMTNGPFMEVKVHNGIRGKSAFPGDDLLSKNATVYVNIRIQCPNWIDVNRVQLLLNGKMTDKLNFTRRSNANMFKNGTVKFEAEIAVELTEDTHIIVATAGENLKIGRVQGPRWGELMPAAVANPIYVDLDGDGFGPNRDNLGFELNH
jgi:hypothetical protein